MVDSIKKESVELFVYLIEGSGIPGVQINNTPHLSDMLRYEHTNTSDECHCYPCTHEFSRFSIKDKSKTLSSIICCSSREHHKGIKMFANINTLNGVLPNKFNPNIPKNHYFTFSIFSVCFRFFVR